MYREVCIRIYCHCGQLYADIVMYERGRLLGYCTRFVGA